MNPAVVVLLIAAGAAVGATVAYLALRARGRGRAEDILSSSAQAVADLLQRAHQAGAACIMGSDYKPYLAASENPPPQTVVDRLAELTEEALRQHRVTVVNEGNVIVAVGDGVMGAGVMLGYEAIPRERLDAVGHDLRRLIASFRVSRLRQGAQLELVGSVPDWLAASAGSLESIGFALCESLRVATGRSTAVAVRNPELRSAYVVAVSAGADRRLLGSRVKVDSAVGRACAGEIPVTGTSAMELFGHARSERRRREERGIAFPILDGRQSVGALIVFGPPETLPADARETIMWHCVDAGPRIAAAWQTQVAERAMATDPTTRLLNAEAIARAADEWTEGSCAVAVLEITGFDRLLELGGPPLSAAALRHVSRILRESLREDDLPVRVDQSRFASWLPHTALGDARVVAERFAHGLRTRHLDWAGGTLALACRVGVAAYPETVSDPEDLLEAATEALAAPPAPAQTPAIT